MILNFRDTQIIIERHTIMKNQKMKKCTTTTNRDDNLILTRNYVRYAISSIVYHRLVNKEPTNGSFSERQFCGLSGLKYMDAVSDEGDIIDENVYKISQWLEIGVLPNIENRYLSAINVLIWTNPLRDPTTTCARNKTSCLRKKCDTHSVEMNRTLEIFRFQIYNDHHDKRFTDDTNYKNYKLFPSEKRRIQGDIRTSLVSLNDYCSKHDHLPPKPSYNGSEKLQFQCSISFLLEFNDDTPFDVQPDFFTKISDDNPLDTVVPKKHEDHNDYIENEEERYDVDDDKSFHSRILEDNFPLHQPSLSSDSSESEAEKGPPAVQCHEERKELSSVMISYRNIQLEVTKIQWKQMELKDIPDGVRKIFGQGQGQEGSNSNPPITSPISTHKKVSSSSNALIALKSPTLSKEIQTPPTATNRLINNASGQCNFYHPLSARRSPSLLQQVTQQFVTPTNNGNRKRKSPPTGSSRSASEAPTLILQLSSCKSNTPISKLF